MSKVKPNQVITGPNCRFSYCSVWEPKSVNGSEPKYSVSVLVPKTDKETVRKIREAIQVAYKEGEARLKGRGTLPPLSALRTPLRDGDTERPDDPAYAGMWFLNANTAHRPGVVDATRSPIMDRSEFYSGCYGRASISFFAYNSNGNRGIACGLNNLMKLRDGEPLGGRTSAADDFAGLEDDEEDFLE